MSWSDYAKFLPAVVAIAILSLVGFVYKVSVGRFLIVPIHAVVTDPHRSASAQTRLFFYKGVWATTSGVLAIAFTVTLTVCIAIIGTYLSWPWLIFGIALFILAFFYGYITVFTEISNELGVTTQLYRIWPEVERQKDVLTALASAAMAITVLAVCALLSNLPSSGAAAGPEIKGRMSDFRLVLYAAAATFVIGDISIFFFHRLPSILLDRKQDEYLRKIATIVSLQAGALHSLGLAGLFLVSHWVLDRALAAAVSEAGAQSLSIQFVFSDAGAMLAPILAAASTILQPKLFPALPFDEVERDGPKRNTETLSVATFNVGLLDIRLLGRTLVQPAPHIAERFAALPSAIHATGADIVCLQEIYRRSDKIALAKILAEDFPYSVWPRTDPGVKLDSGLMIVSRYKILWTRFARFEAAPPDERILVKRGYLEASIETPLGLVRLVTFHTTAGGLVLDPEDAAADIIRSAQIKEMLAAERASPDEFLILAGDLNAGPCLPAARTRPAIGWAKKQVGKRIRRGAERLRKTWKLEQPSGESGFVSPVNYRLMVKSGFVDTFAVAGVAEPGSGARDETVTWDTRNPLNQKGPHAHQRPQRIDHIFVPDGYASAGWEILRSSRILDEPRVPVPGGSVTVSDHCGIITVFARKKKGGAPLDTV